MNKFTKLLIVLGVCNLAVAAAHACTIATLQFDLNPESPADCKDLGIEGRFSFDTCTDGRFNLTGQDGSLRIFYKDSSKWVAKRAILDYTNNMATTEIFLMDDESNNYSVMKTEESRDGSKRKKTECSGTYSTLAE